MKIHYSQKNNFSSLKRGIMTILGGALMVSCGSHLAYTETDGIYYDPKTDKIEQKVAMRPTEKDYEYESEQPSTNIIEQSMQNEKQQADKYNKYWNNKQSVSTSDWGIYTGTQNNYHNHYWSSPYYNSFYSPYYFGMYNSYFGPYWGSGFGLGYSWGNPYYRSSYHPYWGYGGYYSPYYDPFYHPYYGYYGGYYGGYYPRYYNRGYYAPTRNYRKSDADAVYRGNNRSQSHSNNWGQTRTQQHGRFEREPNWGNRTQSQQNMNNSNRSSSWGNSSSQQQNNSGWGNRGNGGNFHNR